MNLEGAVGSRLPTRDEENTVADYNRLTKLKQEAKRLDRFYKKALKASSPDTRYLSAMVALQEDTQIKIDAEVERLRQELSTAYSTQEA